LKGQLKSLKDDYDALKVRSEVANGKLRDKENDLEELRRQLKDLEYAKRERSREASTRRREANDLRAQLNQYQSIARADAELIEGEQDEELMKQQDNFKLIGEQLMKLKEQLDSDAILQGTTIGTSRQGIVTSHSRQSSDVSKSFSFKAA
jgi:predicted nuclease with TOPRIM domain